MVQRAEGWEIASPSEASVWPPPGQTFFLLFSLGFPLPQLRWKCKANGKKKMLEIVAYPDQAQIIVKTGENLHLGDKVMNSEASPCNESLSKPRRIKVLCTLLYLDASIPLNTLLPRYCSSYDFISEHPDLRAAWLLAVLILFLQTNLEEPGSKSWV